MNLGLYRRENLQSGDSKMVGDATTDQFQRTHGALVAWQEVEHTDDGHHTDIHATSITVDGDAVVGGGVESGEGGFTGEDGNVAIGDLPIEQVPGQPPQSPGYGIKIGPWRILSDPQNSPGTPTWPSLAFQFLNEAFGPYLFRFFRGATYDWTLAPLAGVLLRLGAATPGSRLASIHTNTLDAMGAATVGSLNVGGDAVITGSEQANTYHALDWIWTETSFYELDRVVPLGYFQDVPFSAGNFYVTAPVGAAWMVSPANVQTNRFTVIGKTMTWVLYLNATSIILNPTQLLVKIPGGYTSAAGRGAAATGQLYDTAYNRGLVYVASPTEIGIQKDPIAAFTANVNGTFIILTITLEIN